MKKVYLFICLPLLLAFTLADWQSFTLDEHVSVQLPILPTEVDAAKLGLADKMPTGTRLLFARGTDGLYQLISAPAPTAVAPAELPMYYDGVVKGLVTNQGHSLLRRTSFTTPAGAGVDIQFQTAATSASSAKVLYNRCVLVGNVSYILGYMPLGTDTVGSAAQCRRFFTSMTVKP